MIILKINNEMNWRKMRESCCIWDERKQLAIMKQREGCEEKVGVCGERDVNARLADVERLQKPETG